MIREKLLCALTAACALLIMPGCKSDTAKDATTPGVLVLEYGVSPRMPLRYLVPEGSVTTSTVELSITSMVTTTSEGRVETQSPGLRLVVSSGPVIKLPNGNARFDIRIVAAEAVIPPGIDADAERDLKSSATLLEDVGGWVEMDSRGNVRRSELNQAAKNPKLPARLLMILVQVHSSLARVILPHEPVGRNAIWEASKQLKVYGFEIQVVNRYTFIDRVRDQLKLHVEIVQTAPKQTLDFEEEDSKYKLESLSTRAEGDIILDLNALEGSARIAGQAAEVLKTKTGEGKDNIELERAFQLRTEVSHQAPAAASE